MVFSREKASRTISAKRPIGESGCPVVPMILAPRSGQGAKFSGICCQPPRWKMTSIVCRAPVIGVVLASLSSSVLTRQWLAAAVNGWLLMMAKGRE